MDSYPQLHQNYIKVRALAKSDKYGRMTRSETRLAYFKELVSYLEAEKFAYKTKVRELMNTEFYQQLSPLSKSLKDKVEKTVYILFSLKLNDKYIVEKSYLLLTDIVRMAKDESATEVINYIDSNEQLKEELKDSIKVGHRGHYREFKDRHYDIDFALFEPTVVAGVEVLSDIFHSKYQETVSYCIQYRQNVYEEVENQLNEQSPVDR